MKRVWDWAYISFAVIFFLWGNLSFLVQGEKNLMWGSVCNLISFVFALVAGYEFGGNCFARELASKINLEQVPVKGIKKFPEQIQITYEDGRLKSVELVPEKTIKA